MGFSLTYNLASTIWIRATSLAVGSFSTWITYQVASSGKSEFDSVVILVSYWPRVLLALIRSIYGAAWLWNLQLLGWATLFVAVGTPILALLLAERLKRFPPRWFVLSLPFPSLLVILALLPMRPRCSSVSYFDSSSFRSLLTGVFCAIALAALFPLMEENYKRDAPWWEILLVIVCIGLVAGVAHGFSSGFTGEQQVTGATTTGTCQECQRHREGEPYQFHYGRELESRVTAWYPGFIHSTPAVITTTYEILGTGTAFICNGCVSKYSKKRRVLWLLLFFAVTLLIISQLGNPEKLRGTPAFVLLIFAWINKRLTGLVQQARTQNAAGIHWNGQPGSKR